MAPRLAAAAVLLALLAHTPAADQACAAGDRCDGADEDASLLGLRRSVPAHRVPTRHAEPQSLAQRGAYTKAQFLGLRVNTFPAGIGSSAAVYLGDHDAMKDGATRAGFAKALVDQIANLQTAQPGLIDPSPGTLKVFLAPEFLFRGGTGAYDIPNDASGADVVRNIFQVLEQAVQDPKLQDWLFVFGTVIASDGQNLYYNVAPIYTGGPSSQRFLAQKRYISGIDYLGFDVQCVQQGSCDPPPSQKFNSPLTTSLLGLLQSNGYTVIDDNVFQVNGLRLGIEICLDHAAKALTTAHPQSEANPLPVQLHLVVSAGMTINAEKKLSDSIYDGVPVFLQDGGNAVNTEMHYFTLDPDQLHEVIVPGTDTAEPPTLHALSDLHKVYGAGSTAATPVAQLPLQKPDGYDTFYQGNPSPTITVFGAIQLPASSA